MVFNHQKGNYKWRGRVSSQPLQGIPHQSTDESLSWTQLGKREFLSIQRRIQTKVSPKATQFSVLNYHAVDNLKLSFRRRKAMSSKLIRSLRGIFFWVFKILMHVCKKITASENGGEDDQRTGVPCQVPRRNIGMVVGNFKRKRAHISTTRIML